MLAAFGQETGYTGCVQHAQNSLWYPEDSNLDPSCFEGTGLTTAPPLLPTDCFHFWLFATLWGDI